MPVAELSLGPGTWLLLVACGALCGVDAVSWPQAMLSRPLVAGTLGGAVVGSPSAGFVAGAALELLSLAHPPFGAARYPDTGPAGVVAGAGYAAASASAAALAAALIVGWAVGWIGARTVHALRRLNARLLEPVSELAADPRRLERRHVGAIALDLGRAALLTAGFALPAILAVRLADGAAPGAARATAALLVFALAGATGAGARTLAAGWRGWPFLLAGAGGTWLVEKLW